MNPNLEVFIVQEHHRLEVDVFVVDKSVQPIIYYRIDNGMLLGDRREFDTIKPLLSVPIDFWKSFIAALLKTDDLRQAIRDMHETYHIGKIEQYEKTTEILKELLSQTINTLGSIRNTEKVEIKEVKTIYE